jgi:hypothetical protein
VIRNVCIHVSNEQPLLVDLYDMPSSADAGLVCTNVRSMDGKRPVFVDQTSSTFFFPYHVVRFLEIPQGEMAASGVDPHRRPTLAAPVAEIRGAPDGDEPAMPEDVRDGADAHESLLPVAVGAPGAAGDDDGELELEIDEDFLQRIRAI